MNYYLDTEFIEGKQDKRFLGIKYGETKPTIDLISIALVSEDNKEYYAISKDFNLKEAWNRYDIVVEQVVYGDMRNRFPEERKRKVYWIRENVLRPIFNELWYEKRHLQNLHHVPNDFTFFNFKKLINLYGKTNKQISKEIIDFTFRDASEILKNKINFYTYYGDYDWVVFCWLFGKMIDLPKGFPMYSKDLKQIIDEIVVTKDGQQFYKVGGSPNTLKSISDLKNHPDYPKQSNEHNALADARWNKKLHEFLNSL